MRARYMFAAIKPKGKFKNFSGFCSYLRRFANECKIHDGRFLPSAWRVLSQTERRVAPWQEVTPSSPPQSPLPSSYRQDHLEEIRLPPLVFTVWHIFRLNATTSQIPHKPKHEMPSKSRNLTLPNPAFWTDSRNASSFIARHSCFVFTYSVCDSVRIYGPLRESP